MIVINLSKSLKIIIGIVAVACIAALLIGAAFEYSSAGTTADEIVAEVNGDPITAAEFNRVLGQQRASVIDYFKRTYGANFDEDFWHTDYNGEVPVDTARNWALEEAVKIKIQLNLAKSNGIIQGTSYTDLLTEMAKENERRRMALQAGEAVYGPTKFDESTFVEFYMSRLLIKLKERLSEKTLITTDEQLKQHYEKVKDALYRLEDNVRFYRISVSYMEGELRGGSEQQQKAMDLLNAIKLDLEQGKEAYGAIKEHQAANAAHEIQISEELFNNETARMYFKSQPELYAVLTEHTEADPVSTVINDYMEGQYVLARIIAREPNGYKRFEDQKGNIREHFNNALFEAYVSKLINEAELNIL